MLLNSTKCHVYSFANVSELLGKSNSGVKLPPPRLGLK